jgi:hypothetical protein
MRSFLTLITLVALAASPAAAQKVEINALTGYMFGASNDYYYNTYNGNLYFEGSIMYGGAIDVDLRNNVMLELQYMFQPTKVRLEGSYDLDDNGGGEVNNHLIQIGGLYSKDLNQKASLFGGLMVGMEIFAPADTKYESETRFLASLTGGAKIWLGEKVGLRLNGMLSMPMIFGGTGIYFGTGGAGYGVSTVVQLFQFSLGGGIVYKL